MLTQKNIKEEEKVRKKLENNVKHDLATIQYILTVHGIFIIILFDKVIIITETKMNKTGSFLRYRARLLEIWQEKYPKKGEQLYNQNEVREINTHTIKTEGTISIQIHNG